MYKYTVEGLAEADQAETMQPAASTSPGSSPQAASHSRQKYQYELKGVVVHSGTAFAGHYYSFIKVSSLACCVQRQASWFGLLLDALKFVSTTSARPMLNMQC